MGHTLYPQLRHKMLKMQQIFPRCLLYVVFQNPKWQGLLMFKGIYIKKDQREFCARKSKKYPSLLKCNLIWKKVWCIKLSVLAIIFSNSFTYNQAEQIRKGVICVQILLEIHLTEHGRFHFRSRTTFYTPVLGTLSRHMTSKWHRFDVMTSHRCQYNVMHLQGSNVVFVLKVLYKGRYTCIS